MFKVGDRVYRKNNKNFGLGTITKIDELGTIWVDYDTPFGKPKAESEWGSFNFPEDKASIYLDKGQLRENKLNELLK